MSAAVRTLLSICLVPLLSCNQHVRTEEMGQQRYQDIDQDGFGGAPTEGSGRRTVTNSDDCDDNNADIHPEMLEDCDGVDQDCDGVLDEGTFVVYDDNDRDSYGDDASARLGCQGEDGVRRGGDCNDENAWAYPGATERCDGTDRDCDGVIDEGFDIAYADADGDGFGDESTGLLGCQNDDRVEVSGDCDDGDASVYPGAVERCDGRDQDCDGAIDEDRVTRYVDEDGDGYGPDSSAYDGCVGDTGGVLLGGDCDSTDATISPGTDEVCDGVDQDCDDLIDEDALDGTVYYSDADGDGYGETASAQTLCESASGLSTQDGDCDDGAPDIYPDALEVCDGNGVDEDCDNDADCDDPDCALSCPEADCGDGLDSDADGLVDCEDGDCINACVEGGTGSCTDGVDDDGDGVTDCEDEDCWGRQGCMAVSSRVRQGNVTVNEDIVVDKHWLNYWRDTKIWANVTASSISGTAAILASSSSWSCTFRVPRARARWYFHSYRKLSYSAQISTTSSSIQRQSTTAGSCGMPPDLFLPRVVHWRVDNPSAFVPAGASPSASSVDWYVPSTLSTYAYGNWSERLTSTTYTQENTWFLDVATGDTFIHAGPVP